MQLAVARIVALVLMGSLFTGSVFASVAEAAIIRGSGTFEIEYSGDEEHGGVFDPPLLGSGSFEIRSRPYDPDDVFEVHDFDVLDFDFSFFGHTWDESDLEMVCCPSDIEFTPDGEPLSIDFIFDNGDANGVLAFGIEVDIFGMTFFAPNLEFELFGNSDRGTAGVTEFDFRFVVLPEPGSFALFSLGLFGLGLTRRRPAS